MTELTQRGIAALKSGNRADARKLFAAALKENPNDALAWLWLSGALERDQERADCLRQVLRIDPGNTTAARGLAKILEQQHKQTEPAAPPQPVPPPQRTEQQTRNIPAPAVDQAPPVEAAHKVERPAQEETPAVAQLAEPERTTAEDEAAPKQQPTVENPSPWATAHSAADSVASAVYGLRAELAAPEESVAVEQPEAVEQPVAMEQPAAENQPLADDETGAMVGDPLHIETSSQGQGIRSNAFPGDTAAAAAAQAARAPSTGRTAARPPAERSAQAVSGGRAVFSTRPSIVPALISFWVFLLGSVAAGIILSRANSLAGTLFALAIGFLLELVVVFVIIRNFGIRYELTSQQLTLNHKGKRVSVPIAQILHAECRQSMVQRLVGLGDIYLNATVSGELTHLRMRDVPQCETRTQQIVYLVKDQV